MRRHRPVPGGILRPAPCASVCTLLFTGCALLVTACGGDVAQMSPVAAGARQADTLARTLAIALDTAFGGYAGLAIDDEGRMHAADPVRNVVHVLGADGSRRFVFGAALEPPLARPCCPAFAEGILWVRDAGNRRYVGWRVDADSAVAVAVVPMAHADAASRAPIVFDDAGRLVDSGTRRDAEGQARRHHFHLSVEGRVEQTYVLPAVPPESTGVHTVRLQHGDRKMVYYVVSPHAPAELIADGPGGAYAYALSSRYEIAWHGARGERLQTIQGEPAAGPPLSARERAAAEADIARIAEQVGVPAVNLGLSVPPSKQPLRDLWFDRAGRLWVELAQPDGALRRAHVYDASGTRVREVAWPEHVQLRDGAVAWPDPANGAGAGLAVWGLDTDTAAPAIVRLESVR